MPQPLILVVDDDELVSRLLQFLLTSEGYDVEVARNGLEALDHVSTRTPDAILLDLEMPVMDGTTFFHALRASPDPRARAVPVVVLSGIPVALSQHLGAEAALGKPFEREELLTLVRGVLPNV